LRRSETKSDCAEVVLRRPTMKWIGLATYSTERIGSNFGESGL
jgi:hypothetical protein